MPELANFLIQLPIVAAFMWFVLEMDKRNKAANKEMNAQNQAFIKEQREADRKALTEIVTSLENLTDKFDRHDNETREAIVVMKERTSQKQQQAKL